VNFVVPEAHDPEPDSFQLGRARRILLGLPAMLTAVDFDDQARGEAREVDHVRPERNLAPKVEAIELTAA
jgi:hypothetical protein